MLGWLHGIAWHGIDCRQVALKILSLSYGKTSTSGQEQTELGRGSTFLLFPGHFSILFL